MLSVPASVPIYLCTMPTDMRVSAHEHHPSEAEQPGPGRALNWEMQRKGCWRRSAFLARATDQRDETGVRWREEQRAALSTSPSECARRGGVVQ